MLRESRVLPLWKNRIFLRRLPQGENPHRELWRVVLQSLAEMISRSHELWRGGGFTPHLSSAAGGAMGWDPPRAGLPTWHFGSAILKMGLAMLLTALAAKGSRHSSSLGSQGVMAPTETASITHAQVSLLLLPALQLSARLCSVMEGEFLQVNFWLTVFASCHQHTTSCQHISRGSSRQCIQCSPRRGLVPFLLSPSVTSAGLLGWQVWQEVAEGRV